MDGNQTDLKATCITATSDLSVIMSCKMLFVKWVRALSKLVPIPKKQISVKN